MLSAYRNVKEIERIVLCDIWNDGFASPEIVKMNLKALNLQVKPQFIIGDSKLELPTLDGEFDYILVDGDHDKTAALNDLENVVRLCAKGGVIVFDDISPYGCNLLDVWEQFVNNHKDAFIFDHNLKGKGTAWAEKK
jgi:predicted O-methyltransferase YrrM